MPRMASAITPAASWARPDRPEHDEQAHAERESEEDPHGARQSSPPAGAAARCRPGSASNVLEARLEGRRLGDAAHQPAADDHAVRDLAHLRGLLRRADPEADRHRARPRPRAPARTTSPSSGGSAARSPVTPVTDTT